MSVQTRMHKRSALSIALCAGLALSPVHASESRCFGTVAKGHLERGVRLPQSGPNFEAYIALGWTAGRTYVHSTVAEIVTTVYGVLASREAGTRFVYGETGWEPGGRFRPHRSHQNGLSVDFFVPVRDQGGKPTLLPIGLANKLGYGIEFDSRGRFEQYMIDYEAIGEHLYQLDAAARARGAGIAMVIFDSQYLPLLFASSRGPYLRQNVPFMKGKPWVRHDEHYHVDFSIRCARNAG